jgi:hypothetical protein
MYRLFEMCKDKEWFSDVSTELHDRYIVYVHYMDADIFSFIPQTFNGKQIVIHFAANRKAVKDYWINTPNTTALAFVKVEEDSLEFLIDEIERLAMKADIDTLISIFEEVHDGPENAVTNLSGQYPEIRKRMEKLYDTFGYDIVWEELDEYDYSLRAAY